MSFVDDLYLFDTSPSGLRDMISELLAGPFSHRTVCGCLWAAGRMGPKRRWGGGWGGGAWGVAGIFASVNIPDDVRDWCRLALAPPEASAEAVRNLLRRTARHVSLRVTWREVAHTTHVDLDASRLQGHHSAWFARTPLHFLLWKTKAVDRWRAENQLAQ